MRGWLFPIDEVKGQVTSLAYNNRLGVSVWVLLFGIYIVVQPTELTRLSKLIKAPRRGPKQKALGE